MTETAEAGTPVGLSVVDVSIRFGGVTALDGVSLEVPGGEICAIIGPNGAGKTTLFNVISGIYAPSEGRVVLGDEVLTGKRRDALAVAGVARTFQNVALFPHLSVIENVLVGGHTVDRGDGFLAGALRWPAARRRARGLRDRAMEALELVGVADLADSSVRLPFGTQKRVELARAVVAQPRVLLLDEPAAGLTHSEVDELGELLRMLHRRFGLTTVLVEHHMRLVGALSDRVVALNFGRVMSRGTPAEVASDPAVIEAYLGVAS